MKLFVSVLMLLTLGAVGKVVKDFSREPCSIFFLEGEPPKFITGNKPSQVPPSGYYNLICQRYGAYRYATLYDTDRKIPVYSAYEYEQRGNCEIERPQITWKIEPQLEDSRNDADMALQNTVTTSNQQAYNSDYKRSKYDKGHLYPFCHTPTQEAAVSTFTLTNAAPQKCDFNRNWYDEVESRVTPVLNDCVNRKKRAYVVTGVVPSEGKEKQTLKNEGKVNVPSHFWTAYCCCDNNNQCQFGGYIMYYTKDKADFQQGRIQFEEQLTNLYNAVYPTKTQFKVFKDGRCP